MNRSFFYRHFKYWLNKNRKEFLVEPYIAHVRKNSFRVYFRGCKGLIFLLVNRSGEFSVWSYYKSEAVRQNFIEFYGKAYKDENILMDWCYDIDYSLKKNAQGAYYCDFCIDENGKPFKTFCTRSEFLIKQTYTHFLKWSNEVLAKSDCIAFYQNYTKIGQKKIILNATIPHRERDLINNLVPVDGPTIKNKRLDSNNRPIYIFDIPKKWKFRVLDGEKSRLRTQV